MSKRYLFLAALVFCMGCDQDPLKGYSADVRDSVPPKEKPKDNRPVCPAESLHLDWSPAIQTFKETKEGEIHFTARAHGCDVKEFELVSSNLPLGSTLTRDGNEFTLKWTPSSDIVTGGEIFGSGSFMVTLLSTDKDKAVKSIEREVNYSVLRAGSEAPEVVSVKLSNPSVPEQGSITAYVVVKDVESIADKVAPQLEIITTDKSANGAIFAGLYGNPKKDIKDPSLWEYTVDIDVNSYDVTSSSDEFQFGVYARSNLGIKSASKTIKFKILNRVGEANISWPEENLFRVKFKAGQKNAYSFWVTDPRQEGDVSVSASFSNTCSSLPGPASCTCKIDNGGWSDPNQAYCSIVWDIPATFTDTEVYFDFDVYNQNPNEKSDRVESSFSRIILVEPAPPPPTPPQPQPDPSSLLKVGGK